MKKTLHVMAVATLSSALIVAMAPASAQAFAVRGSQVEKKFKAADKDGNGQLTRVEAEAGMPVIAKNFDRIDVSKKGYLTLDEIKKATNAQ